MPDTNLGYKIMRRYFLGALVSLAFVGVGCLCVYAKDCTEQIPVANLDIPVPSVHVAGNDDGHCNYCGPKRCPYFRAKNGANPTTCKCGHSKRSHVDSY